MTGTAADIAWHPRLAVLAGAATVPAAVIIARGSVASGLGFAVGVLPAAMIGVLPTLKQRRLVVIAGALFGAFMLIGSIVGRNDVVAIVAMFVVPVLVALLAARRTIGRALMTVGLPVLAVGLSFGTIGDAAGAALAILIGSITAFLISCITAIWPESTPTARVKAPLLESDHALAYGISLGLAAGIATTLSISWGTDHPGWAPAAALFVMRPSTDMQRLRSAGRIVSVTVGGLLAVTVAHMQPPDVIVGLLAVAALAGAGGTRGSRWYVTPLFSTFIVIMLLLASDYSAAAAEWRFAERLGWTVVGVALAYVFGLALPALARRSGWPALAR